MMKKRILLSLFLLIPIFVYNIKQVSRVHIMKFMGQFSIVYQDVKQFSNDLTFVQTIIFNPPAILKDYFNLDPYQFINNNSYYSDISYLYQSPRAPPLIF